MKLNRLVAVSLIGVTLGGCAAAAPEGSGAAAAPLAAERARVYVYRELNPYDSPTWTAVSLNREKVGNSAPGQVFYRDVAPGTYEIEVRSDYLYPNQFKTVTLAPGATVYAKIQDVRSWGKSFDGGGTTFAVTIVDPAVARREIGALCPVAG
ncbi:MAG TPA: DUF2846 domain-containing protein [Stellaceae bacterium]|nr:DUF2846 domain-containing protein [Stellaceae bacterium]